MLSSIKGCDSEAAKQSLIITLSSSWFTVEIKFLIECKFFIAKCNTSHWNQKDLFTVHKSFSQQTSGSSTGLWKPLDGQHCLLGKQRLSTCYPAMHTILSVSLIDSASTATHKFTPAFYVILTPCYFKWTDNSRGSHTPTKPREWLLDDISKWV